MRKRLLALAASLTLVLVTASAAVAATVTVTPSNTDGWTAVHESCNAVPSTGSQAFVNGPATPPAGSGSYELRIGANPQSYETFRQKDYNGVKLSNLTSLGYWTYVQQFGQGSSGQAPYLDLYVDNNNDGVADDTLTFEPIYQTGTYSGDTVPNQGAVTLNTWQKWDALHGGWWSDNAGNGGPPLVTLAHYVTDHPDARIANSQPGGLLLSSGCGGTWTSFVGNADAFTVGVTGTNTTYDFELTAQAGGPPTNKAQCKKGGWKHFSSPSFKNQGQCVSYVNHHNGKGKDDEKTAKANHGNNQHNGSHR
jgi:hypothetical protein